MKYGLLGEKLSHSYSPIVHKFVFEQLNIDATYELLECDVEGLKYYIDELRKGNYTGFNVTIPYKKTVMSLLDEIDDKALKIGSVNTVYVKDGKVENLGNILFIIGYYFAQIIPVIVFALFAITAATKLIANVSNIIL